MYKRQVQDAHVDGHQHRAVSGLYAVHAIADGQHKVCLLYTSAPDGRDYRLSHPAQKGIY